MWHRVHPSIWTTQCETNITVPGRKEHVRCEARFDKVPVRVGERVHSVNILITAIFALAHSGSIDTFDRDDAK